MSSIRKNLVFVSLISLSALVFLLMDMAISGSVAIAGTTERVSVDSSSAQANGYSQRLSINGDGRYVAFESSATNLVAGDTNGVQDIFVHDRLLNVTERVSVDSMGAEGNSLSERPKLSADGRYVAFESNASNLVAGDTNGVMDIFVHDRVTGTTERVSVDSMGAEGNGYSWRSSISGDGRYVAFESSASNLVVWDTNGWGDIFVHDRVTGATERVSVDSFGAEGNGYSYRTSINDDGSYVSFVSDATNLVVGDTNGWGDIFVHDRGTGVTERVSVDSFGTEGNGPCLRSSISDDGRYVSFESSASNLVVGDTNGVQDIFVHDRMTGVTERVSVDSIGTEANGSSGRSSISGNGSSVAFESTASNLVAGDTNGMQDIFVHDRLTGITKLMSKDNSGVEGDLTSLRPSINDDGRYVAFQSFATNLVTGDTNGVSDIFVRMRGWGEAVVNSAPADQQNQTAAWDYVSSEYLVLWQDFRNGAANPDIYGARLDSNGNLVAGDLPIVTQVAKQAGPSVASAGGLYLAVWVDHRTKATTGTDIYGAWILPDGSLWGTDFVITNAAANQRAASVVYDPYTGNFLVTWIDDALGANTDIYGAILSPGGGIVSGPFSMVTDIAVQRGPFVRYDWGNGHYFMVWFDNRNGNYDVYGSRVSSVGGMMDGSGLGISTASGHQKNPRLADRDPWSGIGNYVVTWVDDRNGQKDIYGAMVDEFGTNVSGDFVIAGGPSAQVAASVDVDWANTKLAVVSWTDNLNGVNYDVYRAEVDQTGAVSSAVQVAGELTGAANQQQGPSVLYSSTMMDNGFLVCWRDNRSGVDYDIYGIKVWP